MSRKTAVAAPAAEPFDELFAAIDAMTGDELRRFLLALKLRFDVPAGPIHLDVNLTGDIGAGASRTWEWFPPKGWIVS